ncbi:MAG: hypothetical protein IPN68_09205 [Bacteroidetes bacterium]|nr:hypothetical protein [Bacteroidota bacterium]
MKKVFYLLLMVLLFSSCRKTEDINNNILRLYGDALEDIGYGITKAEDGFVITGQLTEVAKDGDLINVGNSVKKLGIIRTNVNGDMIWQKSFGDQEVNVGSKAVVLDDGSVVSVGYATDKTTHLKDVYIVKTDNQGNQITQKYLKIPVINYNQYGIDILKNFHRFSCSGCY